MVFYESDYGCEKEYEVVFQNEFEINSVKKHWP